LTVRVFQHDLHQLFARCWWTIRRRVRHEQTPPPVGLALSLSVHQCARVIVARPPAGARPRDNILLQNMAIDPLRRNLYTDDNKAAGWMTIAVKLSTKLTVQKQACSMVHKRCVRRHTWNCSKFRLQVANTCT